SDLSLEWHISGLFRRPFGSLRRAVPEGLRPVGTGTARLARLVELIPFHACASSQRCAVACRARRRWMAGCLSRSNRDSARPWRNLDLYAVLQQNIGRNWFR